MNIMKFFANNMIKSKILYDSKSFVLLDSTKPFSFMFVTFSDLHTFHQTNDSDMN